MVEAEPNTIAVFAITGVLGSIAYVFYRRRVERDFEDREAFLRDQAELRARFRAQPDVAAGMSRSGVWSTRPKGLNE